MRILVLSNNYPPYEVGGYEQLCRDVAERLAARGHSVAVLTGTRGVDQDGFVPQPAIYRLWQLQPTAEAGQSIAQQFLFTRRKTEAYNRQVFQQVAREFHPDVIFIWNLQGLPQEIAVDAEALPDVGVAYWLAGYTPAEPDLFWRYWVGAPGERSSLQSVKRILGKMAVAQMRREGKPVKPQMQHVAVVSDYMRRKGWQEGTLPAHAEVIYNGVETELFYRPVPPPDAPPPITLLLAGRISEDKGIHVALEAIGKLAQARPQRDFRLLVAGSGPETYLTRLQQLAADYQITDLVSFLGWLPREQLPALMHRSHVLILTSIYPEAFARVVLEGMAAGLAVVGTLTGGTGEILRHEVTGLACASADSDDMARQLARLLNDPQLRYRLAEAGQQVVLQDYTLERMVDNVEALLLRAVTDPTIAQSESVRLPDTPTAFQAGFVQSANARVGGLRTVMPAGVKRAVMRLYWLGYDARDYLAEIVGLIPSHYVRLALYKFILHIRIGSKSSIHRGCRFYRPAHVRIGEHTVINRDVLLDGRMGLVIGNNVSVSEGAALLTLEHDPNDPGFANRGAAIRLDDRVFVGTRAIILPGVHVAEGAVIAAGAVVTKDVEPFTIVGGVPARLIGQRTRDLTYQLDYKKFLG